MQNPALTFLRFVVLIATLGLVTTEILFAQDPLPTATPDESPPPEATPPPLATVNTSTATVTFSTGEILELRSTSDVFPLTSAGAGETLSIQLRFPSPAAGAELGPQPLDGGNVFADNLTIGPEGIVSIQFQVGDLPGIYRLQLEAAGQVVTLQFWVPDLSE